MLYKRQRLVDTEIKIQKIFPSCIIDVVANIYDNKYFEVLDANIVQRENLLTLDNLCQYILDNA